MSLYARDPYVVAGSGRRDPFGRRGRRVGALALYLDACGVADESEAWAFVDAAFRELVNRALDPRSKSRRPANVRANEQRKRWRRTLDALTLRYVHGMSFDRIGARLREPVSRARVRQMIAKGLRVLRHSERFQRFRAALAQELDETTNPLPTRGVRFCGEQRVGSGVECGLPHGHEGFCAWFARSAPDSTGREALEARGESGQPITPAVESGVERASEWNFNPLPTACRSLGRR